MGITIILSANVLFLLLALIALLLISRRNGKTQEIQSQVKEDIDRIKDQINSSEQN